MTPDTPPRSLQQRQAALARANAIRTRRKHVKAELKAGTTSVRDVLLSEDPDFASWKVFDVLIATPGVGRVKANRILATERISPSKTIAGLSERQRGELLRFLLR